MTVFCLWFFIIEKYHFFDKTTGFSEENRFQEAISWGAAEVDVDGTCGFDPLIQVSKN